MWPSAEWADWLFSASNIALIVGLALTVVATIGAVWMANVREGYLKLELSEANERIADASRRGDEARQGAAKANAEAAKANLELEKERIARLELEARLAPRSLTPAQRLIVSAKVKPFAPQAFEFISYQDDHEVRGLLRTIGEALLVAGWTGKPPTGFLLVDLVVGVVVELTTENVEKFRPAAETLAAALNAEGIAATVVVNPRITDQMTAIRIKVGRKP